MSFAVMPLSDYKAACDKVREKVDLTTVKFEETDFGFLRSEVFTVPQDSVYIFSYEFSDSSKFPDLYYSSPEWEGETSPGYFEPIDSNSAETASKLYAGVQYRIFIADSLGLTPKDIFKASLSLDEETVVDFVPPSKIKSGELAEKVDEVYMAGASDFGLKGKGQGELVTLNNVHPIKHEVKVGLSSKNLFNEAEANITKTDDYFVSAIHYSQGAFYELSVEPNEKYTISYLCSTPDVCAWGTQLLLGVCTTPAYSGGTAFARTLIQERHYNNFSADTLTFKVPADVYKIYIQCNLVFRFKNFQIEKSDTATTYAPFVADFSDCKVITSGKNICNLQVPYSIVPDKIITLWESNIPQYIGYRFDTTVESQVNGGSAAMWRFTRADGTLFYDLSYGTFPSGKITTEKAVKVEIVNYVRMVGAIDKIQIEIGTTPSEYTEYVEPTEYTANADGTVEGVKSISPVMNLMADKAGAVINAECFLDPEAVITDLTNTVITLGGEI